MTARQSGMLGSVLGALALLLLLPLQAYGDQASWLGAARHLHRDILRERLAATPREAGAGLRKPPLPVQIRRRLQFFQ
jgi:hypothetical protein